MEQSLPKGRDRGAAGESGMAAVEFALVAPILVAALLGAADLVLGFSALMQVSNAAQAAAGYCLSNGASSCTQANMQTRVTAATNLAVSVQASDDGFAHVRYGCAAADGASIAFYAGTGTCTGGQARGQYARVTVQYVYAPILGGLTGTYTMRRTALVRLA